MTARYVLTGEELRAKLLEAFHEGRRPQESATATASRLLATLTPEVTGEPVLGCDVCKFSEDAHGVAVLYCHHPAAAAETYIVHADGLTRSEAPTDCPLRNRTNGKGK